MRKQILSFDEIEDLPLVIYKYRNWEDIFHKEILSEQIVFMANPKSFEDPLDCKLFKRFDLLTDDDIYNKYLNDSKRQHPTRTRGQHRKFAREWSKKSPMRNKDHIRQMQLDDFNEFDKRFGILSLTGNPSNYNMWEKYSNNHKGFFVGLDPKIMFKYLGGGGRVTYYPVLPDILPFDPLEVVHFTQVFSKELKWEFEQEYRTSKFYLHEATISDRRIKIPKDCFKEIIFGQHQSEEQRENITRVCTDQKLPVEFFVEKLGINNTITIEKLISK